MQPEPTEIFVQPNEITIMPAKSQTTVMVSGGDEFTEGPTEQALGAAPPGDSRSQS